MTIQGFKRTKKSLRAFMNNDRIQEHDNEFGLGFNKNESFVLIVYIYSSFNWPVYSSNYSFTMFFLIQEFFNQRIEKRFYEDCLCKFISRRFKNKHQNKKPFK
jgi:hypothetical protein